MKFSRLLLSDLFVETALASTSASLIMCSQIIYSWSAEQICITVGLLAREACNTKKIVLLVSSY